LAGQNFGGFGVSLPIRQSFIRQKVVRSQLNSERVLSTAKVFSSNFLAVPTLPKFSSAKVLCYTVAGNFLDDKVLKTSKLQITNISEI